ALQGADRPLRDVGRGVEVGLPDLEVDDAPALGLEGAGPHQHLEGGLRPQPRHALRKPHAVPPAGRDTNLGTAPAATAVRPAAPPRTRTIVQQASRRTLVAALASD